MQAQIEERVRPLAQQVVELEVARLREQSSNDQAALNDCLAQIDQCILNCVGQLDDIRAFPSSQRTHRELGAPPEPRRIVIAENFDAAIQARVRLRRQETRRWSRRSRRRQAICHTAALGSAEIIH
jgi:hypothetical protein